MEDGVTIETMAGGFGLVARIKNESNRNATSHIAVISTLVLLRGNFALPMIKFLFFIKIHFFQFSIQNKKLFVKRSKTLC